MSQSLIFATIPQKKLIQGITSSSSTFYINDILSFDGETAITAADLGTDLHYVAFRNDTGTILELMEIDPTTIGTGPITINKRGLSFFGDLTTETAALKLDWPTGTIVMFGTDVPQIFQWLKEYIDAASIAGAVPATASVQGIVKMSTAPASAADPIAVGTNDNRMPVAYAVDSVGTDAYAITPSPVITAYAAGQRFTFKAGTANTGAATLAVSGLAAIDIKKDGSTALVTGDILINQIVEVVYDGTNMQMVSPPRIFDAATQLTGVLPIANQVMQAYQQSIPILLQASTSAKASGSNQSGSVIYVYTDNSTELHRYERDSITGFYFLTHSVSVTNTIPANDFGAIIQIGDYIYLFGNDGTNIDCTRFLAADLTGEQAITVPVVACTTVVTAWTDGTFAYVVSAQSNTTSRKWSISGTTFTAESTATVTTSTFDQNNMSSMYDGTTAYVCEFNSSSPSFVDIIKLTNIDGSTFSTTTKKYFQVSDQDCACFIVNIDSTRIYIGNMSVIYDEAAGTSSRINLFPITKP